MTIDERLERLTERHEALSQSVEILTSDVQALTTEMRSGFAQTLQFINRLANVAEAHEQQLDDLEGK
jgi:archaellum component FlaC